MTAEPEPTFKTTAVVGYRMFWSAGPVLASYSQPYDWAPGENVATCDQGGKRSSRTTWRNAPDGGLEEIEVATEHGPIPAWDCSCGFYVYPTQFMCREKGPEMPYALRRRKKATPFGDFGDGGLVMGKVQAWGRVIKGRDGYRVERARIIALVTDDAAVYSDAVVRYDLEVERPLSRLEEGIAFAWIGAVDDSVDPVRVSVFNPDPCE
jgi:hypothetical protein